MSRLAAAVSLVLLSAGSLVSAPTASAHQSAEGASFTFGTHNSHRGTARFAGFADVICWQEVALPDSKRKLVANLSGYDQYLEPGLAGQVPVSWRNDRFSLVEAESTLAAPRVKIYSPPRYVSRTVLLDTVTGQQFAVYNTHMVQGAWNDRRKPFKQMRKKNWRQHARVLRRELRQADPAIPTLACGDFNRAAYLNLPGMTPVKRESGRPGIDHLYRDSGGVDATSARVAGNAGSDHARLVTTVTLRG